MGIEFCSAPCSNCTYASFPCNPGVRGSQRGKWITVDSGNLCLKNDHEEALHSTTGQRPVSASRSTSLPFSKIVPARTSGTRRGAFTAGQRPYADSMSLWTITIPAAVDPAPLVTSCLSRTVAKVDSIGFVGEPSPWRGSPNDESGYFAVITAAKRSNRLAVLTQSSTQLVRRQYLVSSLRPNLQATQSGDQ